tara:strand:+ start:2491 stop:3006 length:516 start_codon:yes stop_codon:yes gene_type:complete
MKKTIFVLVLTFLTVHTYGQEGFKIGAQGGVALGDYKDKVGVVLGLDLGYMWAISETADLGLATGFLHGFQEKYRADVLTVELPNVQFLPLAASIRIWPSNSFSFGVDVGQALGINDGNDGGLYYRPQIGFLMGAQTELNLSYTGIKQDQESWSTVTFGILYTILSHRSRR